MEQKTRMEQKTGADRPFARGAWYPLYVEGLYANLETTFPGGRTFRLHKEILTRRSGCFADLFSQTGEGKRTEEADEIEQLPWPSALENERLAGVFFESLYREEWVCDFPLTLKDYIALLRYASHFRCDSLPGFNLVGHQTSSSSILLRVRDRVTQMVVDGQVFSFPFLQVGRDRTRNARFGSVEGSADAISAVNSLVGGPCVRSIVIVRREDWIGGILDSFQDVFVNERQWVDVM